MNVAWVRLEGIMSDVIGQDNAIADVPAVQQAVDAGGTVVLHGTFNFVNVSLPGWGVHRSQVPRRSARS